MECQILEVSDIFIGLQELFGCVQRCLHFPSSDFDAFIRSSMYVETRKRFSSRAKFSSRSVVLSHLFVLFLLFYCCLWWFRFCDIYIKKCVLSCICEEICKQRSWSSAKSKYLNGPKRPLYVISSVSFLIQSIAKKEITIVKHTYILVWFVPISNFSIMWQPCSIKYLIPS